VKGPAWVAHELSSGPGVFIGGVVIQNATDVSVVRTFGLTRGVD